MTRGGVSQKITSCPSCPQMVERCRLSCRPSRHLLSNPVDPASPIYSLDLRVCTYLKNYVSKEHTQLTSVTHAGLPQYRLRWSQRLRGLTHKTPPKQAQHSLRTHRANGRLSFIKIRSEITKVWRNIWLHRRQTPGYPVSEWIARVSQFTDWKEWFGQMKACWPAALFLCLQVQHGPRMQRERQSCWAPVSSPTAPSPDCTRAGWLSSSPLDRPAATRWRTETPLPVAVAAVYIFIHASLISFWNQRIICECLTIRNQSFVSFISDNVVCYLLLKLDFNL